MNSQLMITDNDLVYEELKDVIVQFVLDSVDSPHTKRAYGRAINHFLAWYDESGRPPLTRRVVQRYRGALIDAGVSPSSINQRLSAIRKLVREAADNGLIDYVHLQGIERVKGVKQQGRRTGNWLTTEQAQRLLDAPDTSTLRGLRDRALLATLLGCGLRRSELVDLTFQHIQQRSGRWAIIDLVGKHNRRRSIPMPAWCKKAIDAWAKAADICEGRVFLPLRKGGKIVGDKIDPQTVHDVISYYAKDLDLTRLAPHDLRRTFAKLAREGGAALDQIKESLGHASVETTERYIGEMQDFHDAPADRLNLHL